MKNEMMAKPPTNELNTKDVLTVEEVAMYTGYSVKYIYKLCSQRKIPHYNNAFGRRVFFRLNEIIEWCTSKQQKTITQILNV